MLGGDPVIRSKKCGGGRKGGKGGRKDRLVLWDGSAQRVIWTIMAQVNE